MYLDKERTLNKGEQICQKEQIRAFVFPSVSVRINSRTLLHFFFFFVNIFYILDYVHILRYFSLDQERTCMYLQQVL